MNKVMYLALGAMFFTASSAIADDDVSGKASSNATEETTYFNYTSDKCTSIKDAEKLYEIAMTLRDSSDIKDQIGSVDCLIASAVRAFGPAEYELARMYSLGITVNQSNTFAYRWAQMAVMDGYKEAVQLRDKLEKDLSVDELDKAVKDTMRLHTERQKAAYGEDALNMNTSREARWEAVRKSISRNKCPGGNCSP